MVKIIYLVLALVLIVYILLPNPEFPEPLPDSLQSIEPADLETTFRRGYYTDLTRAEVLDHYSEQFSVTSSFGITVPGYRLNYPPEEAQILIRDQTNSTFLEEIVHPLRESLYINGFEPTEANQVIIVDGKQWRQKVIVRYVPSNYIVRLGIVSLTLVFVAVLVKKWLYELKNIKKNHG